MFFSCMHIYIYIYICFYIYICNINILTYVQIYICLNQGNLRLLAARNHAITRLPNRSVSQASVAGLMPKMFEKMQHMYPKAFVPWWSSGGLPLYKNWKFPAKGGTPIFGYHHQSRKPHIYRSNKQLVPVLVAEYKYNIYIIYIYMLFIIYRYHGMLLGHPCHSKMVRFG